MRIEFNKNCTGCAACRQVCNNNCIQIISNENGFNIPDINDSQCIDCGKCVKVCHILNFNNSKQINLIEKAFYGKSTCQSVMRNSSSGGLMTLLAHNILSKQGVVYGAVFERESKRIIMASTKDYPLKALQKSKYAEAVVGNTFSEVKTHLDNGIHVMYVGTPCQIAGLSCFLSKEYDNLLKVDFVCHGVPSGKLFSMNLDHIEKIYNKKIFNIDFRPKEYGWSASGTKYYFEDGSSKYLSARINPYLKAFNSYISLRESCMNCKYVNKRYSDITLGDFWGIHKYAPELNDNKGMSLVIPVTQKGRNTIASLDKNLVSLMEIDKEVFMYIFKEKKFDKNLSTAFFKSLADCGYKSTMNRYFTVNKKDKIINFLVNMKRIRFYKVEGKL